MFRPCVGLFVWLVCVNSWAATYTVRLEATKICKQEKFQVFVYNQKDPANYIYHIEAFDRAKIKISLTQGKYAVEVVSKKGCSTVYPLKNGEQLQVIKVGLNEKN